MRVVAVMLVVAWSTASFDIYMDGLQPERYYKLLVKTEIDGTTTVIDNDQIFKVVRNG